jgi:hypothetical protein
MATLDQLYTRLILDLARDDMGAGGELEQAKIDAVADAIETHASEPFWFNRASGTVSTVNGTAIVPLPSGMRVALVVTYNCAALAKVRLEEIEAANAATPGAPSQWAEDEGAVHLYPTPDAVYLLSVYGIAEIGVPASGGDANIWTTEGRDLVMAEAKASLCRGPLRDPEGLALAKDARQEALTRLRRETRRRASAPMTTDLSAPAAYNILAG